MTQIRPATVAGQFYPAEANQLKRQISELLQSAASVKPVGELKALILPHAGYVFSGPVAAVGYKLLKKIGLKNPQIVLLGPCHHYPLVEPVGAGFSVWETPLGSVKAKALAGIKIFDQAHFDEHSLEVQLPFLQQTLAEFTITPILLNHFSPQLVTILSNLINQISLIIVSSDLSHYHSYEQALEIDSLANQVIPKLDFSQAEQIEACGLGGISTLMKLAQKHGWQGQLLNYQNSGDLLAGGAGDKSRVVGYGCYGFFESRRPRSKNNEKINS